MPARLVRLRSSGDHLLLAWYDVYVGSVLVGSVVYGGKHTYDILFGVHRLHISTGFSFISDAVAELLGPGVAWEFDGWQDC